MLGHIRRAKTGARHLWSKSGMRVDTENGEVKWNLYQRILRLIQMMFSLLALGCVVGADAYSMNAAAGMCIAIGIFGFFGLLMLKRPQDIHWHFVLMFDGMAAAFAIATAIVVGVTGEWYGSALWPLAMVCTVFNLITIGLSIILTVHLRDLRPSPRSEYKKEKRLLSLHFQDGNVEEYYYCHAFPSADKGKGVYDESLYEQPGRVSHQENKSGGSSRPTSGIETTAYWSGASGAASTSPPSVVSSTAPGPS